MFRGYVPVPDEGRRHPGTSHLEQAFEALVLGHGGHGTRRRLVEEVRVDVLEEAVGAVPVDHPVIWNEMSSICGKTRQSKRLSSILILQSRISGNLYRSIFTLTYTSRNIETH
jgi:hypothetical protein